MATEVEEKSRPPRRRLVLLVEPYPKLDCDMCHGEGMVEYEADGDSVEDTCHCCRLEHREPTVDDLVEHLMGIDMALFDQVIDHVTAGSVDPGLVRKDAKEPGQGSVVVPLEVAQIVSKVFLPLNPRKMRSAVPEVIQAALDFKELVLLARQTAGGAS